MFKLIYTKTLDNADDVVAESWECKDKKAAIESFNNCVKRIMDEILSNELMNVKASIHNHKALFKLENTHYCLAIVSK